MKKSKLATRLASFIAILPLALAGNPVQAWEFAYGPAFSLDTAMRRVAPVTTCWGDGYIAVGTQDLGGANPEIYVVRTDNWGWPMWEFTYDVLGLGLPDEGVAIVEVPFTGFAILSNVLNGVWNPALTFIDCNGTFGGTQHFRWGTDLRGQDLIRLQTGNPSLGANPGDFAVAGVHFNGVSEDGFLMRVNAAGGVVWNWSYETGAKEAFNALTEAQPVGTQTAGDVVAVGRYDATGANSQGLAARVDGNTGLLGGPPHCMAHVGQPASQEIYQSVVQLVTPPFAGQFAMTGTILNAAWQNDIWVTRGNPCAVAAQSRIGTPAGQEGGNAVKQVLVAQGNGVPVGSLAIAGFQSLAGGGSEAGLLFVAIGPPMAPILGNLFGDFGAGREIFYSLAENPLGGGQPPGYVLGGLTTTDWEWIGDPQDMYLVYDDPTSAACESNWPLGWAPIGAPVVNLVPQLKFVARSIPVPTGDVWQWNPWQVCF